ncbi:hypothetical protein HDV05_002739 [Chytridiales sp. JEL 0842]|nr:hypothetical protein HDV05_002739 [Chytridiales sp. JEL 0842]
MYPSIASTIADIQRDSKQQQQQQQDQQPKRKRPHRDPKWDRTYEEKRKKLKSRGHPMNLFKNQKPFVEPSNFKNLRQLLIDYEAILRSKEGSEAGNGVGSGAEIGWSTTGVTGSGSGGGLFGRGGDVPWEPLEDQSECYAGSVDCMLRILVYKQPSDGGGCWRFTKQAWAETKQKHEGWFSDRPSPPSAGIPDGGSSGSTFNNSISSSNSISNHPSPRDAFPISPNPANYPTPPLYSTNAISLYPNSAVSNDHFHQYQSPVQSHPHTYNPAPYQPIHSYPPPPPPFHPHIQTVPQHQTTPQPLPRPPAVLKRKRISSSWRVWFPTHNFSRFSFCKTLFAPPGTTAPEFVEMLFALVRHGACERQIIPPKGGNWGEKGLESVDFDMSVLEWSREPYRVPSTPLVDSKGRPSAGVGSFKVVDAVAVAAVGDGGGEDQESEDDEEGEEEEGVVEEGLGSNMSLKKVGGLGPALESATATPTPPPQPSSSSSTYGSTTSINTTDTSQLTTAEGEATLTPRESIEHLATQQKVKKKNKEVMYIPGAYTRRL